MFLFGRRHQDVPVFPNDLPCTDEEVKGKAGLHVLTEYDEPNSDSLGSQDQSGHPSVLDDPSSSSVVDTVLGPNVDNYLYTLEPSVNQGKSPYGTRLFNRFVLMRAGRESDNTEQWRYPDVPCTVFVAPSVTSDLLYAIPATVDATHSNDAGVDNTGLLTLRYQSRYGGQEKSETLKFNDISTARLMQRGFPSTRYGTGPGDKLIDPDTSRYDMSGDPPRPCPYAFPFTSANGERKARSFIPYGNSGPQPSSNEST